MTHLLRSTAICGALLAALPATAQQFAGGQADLTYRGYSDTDADALSARVSGELALSRGFSLQGDVFTGRFGNDFDSFGSVGATLHGLVHISETSTVGAFVTYEELEGASFGSVGVEAGATFGDFAAEVWLGVGEDEFGSDGNYFGLETRRGLGPVNLFAAVEYYNISGDIESVQSGLGLEYEGISGFGLSAAIEQVHFQEDTVFGTSSDSTTSLSFGATYRFGKRPGTVFGERALSGFFR